MLPVLAILGGCSSGKEGEVMQAESTGSAGGADSNPLAGQPIYVVPGGSAARQATLWRAQGRDEDAAAISALATRPTATWITDDRGVTGRVRSLTRRAAEAGETALLVAYYIPGRDCGSFSAGGARSAPAYRAWARAFASGLGDGRAAVILEPDAIPQAVEGCLPGAARAERYELLRFAVRALSARPSTSVYLDAGNAGWIRDSSRLVGPLHRAGIGAAAGFALNVSNYYRTDPTLSYGRTLSRRLGGTHFVIDTSRNGNGPAGEGIEGRDWCNPPGRAVGRYPSTDTGQRLADAYLWVKEPGTSDGTCRGGPPAGQWWPQNALELAATAARR